MAPFVGANRQPPDGPKFYDSPFTGAIEKFKIPHASPAPQKNIQPNTNNRPC